MSGRSAIMPGGPFLGGCLRILKAGAVIVALAAGLPGGLVAAATWQDWAQKGNQAYQRRDLAGAVHDYFEAARLQSGNASLIYNVGACEYLLGRTATAMAWAELSLARNPGAAGTALLLARLGAPKALIDGQKALQAGQWDAAGAAMAQAVQAAPRSGLAWRGLALARAKAGRAQEADAALARATLLDPRNLDLAGVRRAVQLAVEDYLSTRDPAAFRTRRGVRRFREGDLKGAAQDFEAAARLDPGDAQAWYHLALARWKLDDGPGTQAALQRSLALDPSLVGARYLRAAYLQRSGQTEAAREDLTRLVALGDAHGYGSLAWQALGQIPVAGAGGWHAYLRLLGGPSAATTDNGVSDSAQSSNNSQDYLRLSYDLMPGAGPAAGRGLGLGPALSQRRADPGLAFG
jgi:tetratricopeptide (TPR) repeat protein